MGQTFDLDRFARLYRMSGKYTVWEEITLDEESLVDEIEPISLDVYELFEVRLRETDELVLRATTLNEVVQSWKAGVL
jgi:hypothetical protein